MELLYCPWEPATFLFISSNVPLLINYSHFIALFSVLAISIVVFIHNPRSPVARLFVGFSIFFSIWALLDVLLWATNDPSEVMFSWSLQVLIEPITHAIAFYLFYYFTFRDNPPFWINVGVVIVLLPIVVLLPTTLNLEALQLSSCESIEGPIAKYYSYFANVAFLIGIIFIAVKKIPSLHHDHRKTAIFLAVGLVTSLLAFTSGNIIGSFTDDWKLSQYGLFGMPVFAFLIAYSMVQFKAFRIQTAAAQVLVIVLWALVASLMFVESELLKIIAGLTLIFTTVAGYLLIRSVNAEFLQRLQLEELTDQLAKANQRLKILDQMKSEFVSIASHQLRSPLTSIRGYASMLLEGSYGKLTAKGKEAVERIAESSRYMALSVEDYLNVSRIEAGRMKYEMSEFNAVNMASKIVDDVRPSAVKKGLMMTFKSADVSGDGMVVGDIGKTQQIIHNLLDNAIKYTPKGNIKITASDNKRKKRLYIAITDTGVGMDSEEVTEVFEKFVRARNANKVNVTGTGLGLYVARQMAQGMKGDIVVTSPGKEKGSTFTLELPLA